MKEVDVKVVSLRYQEDWNTAKNVTTEINNMQFISSVHEKLQSVGNITLLDKMTAAFPHSMFKAGMHVFAAKKARIWYIAQF